MDLSYFIFDEYEKTAKHIAELYEGRDKCDVKGRYGTRELDIRSDLSAIERFMKKRTKVVLGQLGITYNEEE